MQFMGTNVTFFEVKKSKIKPKTNRPIHLSRIFA